MLRRLLFEFSHSQTPGRVCFVADCDDTSHTDENDPLDARSADYRRRESHNSDSDSDEDELRSIDEIPVETNYVVQQEEEFGCVRTNSTRVTR